MADIAAQGTIAETLGAWTAGLTLDQVPPRARAAARRAMVDVLGVAFAGANAPLARTVRADARASWRDGPCTLIGAAGAGLAPQGAAHVNAVTAHVLDYDANYNTGMVFAPAVLFPALLAAGEAHGGTGADLLTAFAAGTEVLCVLAAALSPEPYRKDRDSLFYKGWFNTAVLGPIGAAAAVSRLLGMDARATTNAIAIAAVQAGGLRIAVGSDMKPYLTGRACETGLRAAFLARDGVQAPADAFEGFRGLIAVINAGGWTPAIFARLGGFADAGTSFKLYPACSSIQAAAEAMERIIVTEGIERAEIASVTCEVTAHIAANLAFPRPVTVTQAQFSMPFALACLLVHGRFTADMLRDQLLVDPAIQRAMDLVDMREALLFADDDAARQAPEATRVILTLKDGRRLSHLQAASTGKPVNPMSDAVLEEKFLRNVEAALSPEAGSALLQRVRGIESLADVRSLLVGPARLNDAA